MKHPNEMDLRSVERTQCFEPAQMHSLTELWLLAYKLRVFENQRKRQFYEIADSMRAK